MFGEDDALTIVLCPKLSDLTHQAFIETRDG